MRNDAGFASERGYHESFNTGAGCVVQEGAGNDDFTQEKQLVECNFLTCCVFLKRLNVQPFPSHFCRKDFFLCFGFILFYGFCS